MTTNTPTIGRVEGYVTDKEFISASTSDERDSMKAVKDLERVVETAVERRRVPHRVVSPAAPAILNLLHRYLDLLSLFEVDE